jgi:riboflavin kinase/FMN adenylyltransferase
MKKNRGRLITLGSFDGVHRGHVALIDRAVQEAKKRRLKSAALTFGLPPRMILDRTNKISILSNAREKEILLRWKGLDEVIVQEFDRNFSQIKPYSFFRDLLLKRYGAKGLVVGLDFRFGINRSAGATELVRWGLEKRIPVWVIPPVRWRGKVVSSTEIRQALCGGKFKEATQLLGHPYLIQGTVSKGRGVGRRIGIPTTNLTVAVGKVLPSGVFAVRGRRLGRLKTPVQFGVCNIGMRPTFLKRSPVTVEIHWLTGPPPRPSESVAIELLSQLRSEKRFGSPRALVRAIAKDIQKARRIFLREAKNGSILRSI